MTVPRQLDTRAYTMIIASVPWACGASTWFPGVQGSRDGQLTHQISKWKVKVGLWDDFGVLKQAECLAAFI